MKIEKTEIWITCERPLLFDTLRDGRAIRGFFGNLYKNRPEFHGHKGNELIYKHPLIQYKIFDGSALVVGLKEGAYLLKAMPKLENFEIYHEKYPILKQNIISNVIPFGLTTGMIRYSFVTPWIALNEENYENYLILRKKIEGADTLLERILVGNILSMSKAFGYEVKGKVQARAKVGEIGLINVKEGVDLLAFNGEFDINFYIPDFWGIGKFSSRGYGAVRRNYGGQTQ